jgi:flagellar biosynthesis chaperone FliJ
MSVVAKYCEECGLKIPQEHFEDGRAISYLYLSYCENCKTKVEKLYNAFQEFASFEAAEEKKSFIYQILVLVVVAVIVAVVSFFISRGLAKSGAKKEIAAVKNELNSVKKRSEREIGEARDETKKVQNELTKLKKKGPGTSKDLEKARQELAQVRGQLDTAGRRISDLEKTRDNERDSAEKWKQEAEKWENIANTAGSGEVPKLMDQVETLKGEVQNIKDERDKALAELDEIKRSGISPAKGKQLEELAIRRLILAWVNAINGRDATALKKLYSSRNRFSRNSLSWFQSSLDGNEGAHGVKIRNIEIDTTTAVARVDVEYRAGKFTDRKSGIQMKLSKEMDKWLINDEGF